MAGTTETCEEENMGEEKLVPKRHSTSVIWKYFGFTKDDPLQTQVLCKSCPAVVATSRGKTTNLHSHLTTQPQRSVRSAPRSPKSKTTDYSGSSKAVGQASIPQSSHRERRRGVCGAEALRALTPNAFPSRAGRHRQ